jgi:hypothetical protein
VTVDGTAAILYDNGNQVGAATISASHGIDNCTDAGIASDYSGASNFFNGTLFRTRFFNKTLSPENVTSVYESASLDYADQWGSQTEKITGDNSTFASGLGDWATGNNWATQTNTSSKMQLAATGINQRCVLDQSIIGLVAGQRYRFTYDASAITGDVTLRGWDGGYLTFGTIVAGTAQTIEFEATGITSGSLYIGATASGDAITLDNLGLVRIGCVADYDFSYANPTQSNIVRNRNDTVTADGTAAGGVKQITKLEAVNTNKLSVGGTTPLVGIGLPAGSTPVSVLDCYIARDDPDSTATWMSGVNIRRNEDGQIGMTLGMSTANVSYLQAKNVSSPIGMDFALNPAGGNVGIGTVSPTVALDVVGTVNAAALNGTLGATTPATVAATTISASGRITGSTGFTATSSVPTIVASSTNLDYSEAAFGRIFVWGPNTTTAGELKIKLGSSDNSLLTTHAFTPTGLAVTGAVTATTLSTFSAGIAFQSATSSTESGVTASGYTLDKYETGDWTPVNSGSGSSSGTWDTTLTGKYTRVGNLVTVTLKITGTTMDFSGTAGYRTYTGLPFTSSGASGGACRTNHAASFGATASVSGTAFSVIPVETGSGTNQADATATYFV